MALVYNKQTENLKGFKNGINVLNSSGLEGSPGNRTNVIDGKTVIGRGVVTEAFGHSNIILDELLFYNRPLSTEEVKAIYNSYPDPNW